MRLGNVRFGKVRSGWVKLNAIKHVPLQYRKFRKKKRKGRVKKNCMFRSECQGDETENELTYRTAVRERVVAVVRCSVATRRWWRRRCLEQI